MGWYAALVVVWLSICSIACIGALAYLLLSDHYKEGLLYISISVIGGGLGSSISALMSVTERISHGWETKAGTKLPQSEKKDRFVAKMIPIFCIRPLFGAAMGFLLYLGIAGGFLLALKNPEYRNISNEGLAFLSVLTGLFAKTFLEKLRDAFDSLFGKAKAKAEKKDKVQQADAGGEKRMRR